MSAPDPLPPCPECQRATLAPHCKSPTCDWWRCAQCRATMDEQTGRGWDSKDRPTRWEGWKR